MKSESDKPDWGQEGFYIRGRDIFTLGGTTNTTLPGVKVARLSQRQLPHRMWHACGFLYPRHSVFVYIILLRHKVLD